MKLVKLVLLLVLLPIVIIAQNEEKKAVPDSLKKWKLGGTFSLTTNQASYTNWAAGGESAISVSSLLNYAINYKDSMMQWDNNIKLGYGIVWQKESGRKKGDDIIDISSKYGYKSFRHWYYSAIASFSTQFDKGFNTDTVKISEFMAPGYVSLSLGMDYKPNTYFSLLIAPISGKATFVMNDSLANAGAYGVEAAFYNADSSVFTPGEKSKYEFGGSIKINFKKELFKNILVKTKLDLFSNYLYKPENIDVNWELDINLKVNKFITTSISTKMVYDDDIKIGVDDDSDGEITKKETRPRLQFKEVISLGVTFNL